MTLLDTHRIDDVLAELVAHDVLSTDQAHAVSEALVAEAPPAAVPAPTGRVALVPAASAPGRSALRSRLVEAAAYLGAVLVAAGVLALVAQSWDDLTVAAHVWILAGFGVVLYAIGLGIALLVGGGPVTVRLHVQAPRRRVAGALMTVGAVLAASAAPAGLDGSSRSMFLAGVIAFVAILPVQFLAPSAVTEIALYGSAVVATSAGLQQLVPERPESDFWQPGRLPARTWDYLVPVSLTVLGLVWAGIVSRLVTLPVVAQVLGLGTAFVASTTLATDDSTHPAGVAALAVLALLGIAVFVRERAWPWLVLTVLSATVAVFVLVAQAANPALAFLVSGLVLLMAAAGATLLGKRRT